MAAIKKQKLGPGSLIIGETGTPQEFAAQLVKASVEPSFKDGDPIYVLSGDVDEEEGEFEGKLTGEFYQDYDSKSLIAFCWDNNGKLLPFTFKPRTDGALSVKGYVKIRPVNIGGDVHKENTTEFEFNMPDMPKLDFTAQAQAQTQK